MIIDEKMLIPFRDEDGFCYLRRDHGALTPDIFQPENYLKLAEHMKRVAENPTLLQVAKLKPTHTGSEFAGVWSNEKRGHQAIPVLSFTSKVPQLLETRTWQLLSHQCAGHHCNYVTMIATKLKPKAELETAFNQIAEDYFYALKGCFDGPDRDAETTQRYLSAISKIGLTCSKFALQHLRESVYPIDATAESLQKMAEDVEYLFYYLDQSDAHPVILFLSENSD